MAKRYGSAAAFKTALETHLRRRAADLHVPFQTVQLKFAMERLLARLFHAPAPPWLLKGGFAMDLRFRPRARTTKDVDLSVPLAAVGAEPDFPGSIRDRLQDAADTDLGDHMNYRIGVPRTELTNAPGGGARYPCTAVLAGKVYASFHIDLGVGDTVLGEPERLVGDDALSFAGLGPATALAVPAAQQFAEKVHAYTYPWAGRVNTRTKDLVDLVLLVERGRLDPATIRTALAATFAARATHLLPDKLQGPPKEWASDFAAMAREADLSKGDYREAFAVLEGYWRENGFGGEGE
jgi:Nucleotidyl transferase AbiEii toxin, Type IV TA system